MKTTFSLIIVLFLSSPVFSQRLELKKLGFSMDIPNDWISLKEEAIIENLNKYDFTDKQLNALLNYNNSALNICSYTKYDPKKYAGIIPTIKIRTLSNPTSTIADFLKYVEASTESAKKVFDNFRYEKKPTITKITNQDVVLFSVKFSLKNDGSVYEIVSKSYYIPKDGYYISLNFIEKIGKENNEPFFEQLINSIKLTK